MHNVCMYMTVKICQITETKIYNHDLKSATHYLHAYQYFYSIQ